MISFQIIKDEGIVIVEPSGPLEHSDFEKLRAEVDAYIEENGSLNGLMIRTRSFPGWESFEAFIDHMKFIKGHHEKIRRVAVVTDSKVLAIGPGIAKHFVSAEIKHFVYDESDAARKWLQKSD
jgi:hypothetical protein